MIRAVTLFTLIGAAGIGVQVMANDLDRPPPPRRQLAICMNKQMAASRTISYNAASAVCKAQLKAKAPELASTIPPKPANGMTR